MAHFDFIESAMYGYRTTWNNRHMLLRLAALPFLVKLGCYAALLLLDMDDQYLRHGLILLPSFFAEGFLLAYVIGTVMAGQSLSTNLNSVNIDFRNVKAAMVVYVLVQLGLSFTVGSVMDGVNMASEQAAPASPSFGGFLFSIAALAFTIWAFRLVWVYVPMAMGISITAYLRRARAFSFSFYLLGCWLICFVPLGLLVLMVSQILSGFFSGDTESGSLGFSIIFAILQCAAEIIIGLVSSLAIAYGIRQMIENKRT